MCCDKELMERVLELLEIVNTVDLKGNVTPLICEFKK